MTSLQIPETTMLIDSMKIQSFMKCPRRFFYEFVLGWQPEAQSVHLGFGIAIHDAMEHLMVHRRDATAKGYTNEALLSALYAFKTSYREQFPDEQNDEVREPKTLSNGIRMLTMYVNNWAADDFRTLEVEVAGSVIIDDRRLLYFRSDAIIEDPNYGICSDEHKTTGAQGFSSSWQIQWPLKIQVGTYSHMLHCLFDDVYGVIINGMKVCNPPRIKKDGEPYANSRDCEFLRVPSYRSPEALLQWLYTVRYYFDEIERQLDVLTAEDDAQVCMRAFPLAPESCSDYGGCPFHGICTTRRNPLQEADRPPMGYCTRHWDPRSEMMKAGKVIENLEVRR